MNQVNQEQPEASSHSFGRMAVAVLVLLVCAWLLLHLLFHVVIVVATIVAVVLAVVGAIWAMRVLF